MKRLYSIILSCVIICSLAACGTQTAAAPDNSVAQPGSSQNASSSGGEAGFTFDQPITVLVPFKAGSTTDTQIRLMQSELEKALGTTLVIVNADGGSGTIGTTEYLNNYKPDGYTVLYALATPVVYKPLTGDTVYTYEEDLQAVARTMSLPMYLILSDGSSFSSGEDVINYIRDNPGKFTYSNVGNGGNGHLAFASFLAGEGLEATSVPYSGGTAECYTAMMGGEVDAAVYGEADLLAREGCHGAINLGSKSTVASLQDVPTLSELGYEGYETNNLAGFYYHKEVPAEIAATFESAVESVLCNDTFTETATDSGFTPSYGSAQELHEQLLQTIETATPVMKALGYTP